MASDIAVVSSHAEPPGNATPEAMSFVVPVTGSAVDGIPEMVTHEQTGLLVPPRWPDQLAGAISRLLLDPVARTAMGDRGRKRCEAYFSLDAHVTAVLDQYRRVVAGSQRTNADLSGAGEHGSEGRKKLSAD
jgi:glycosyltransferase involved in cell wall biosynthesis